MSVIRTANGRRIFYDVIGEGPPLLAITGLAGSRQGLLASLGDSLTSRLQIIAMDNRDAGESDPESDYYTMEDMAGDAIALLDALGLGHVDVIGFSMGGTVAMQLAIDHPLRIDRLVLVSAHAYNEPSHQAGEPLSPPPAWWTDDPAERWQRLMPELVGPVYRERLTDAELGIHANAERGNRAIWAGVMRQVATRSGLDMRNRLGEIHARTLVIHGQMDTVVPPEHGEMLAAGIPDAQLYTLPQAGHLVFTEEPDDATHRILDFLGEADNRAQYPGHSNDRPS